MAERISEGEGEKKAARSGSGGKATGGKSGSRAKPDGEDRSTAAAPKTARRGSGTTRAKPRTKQPDLKKDLRDFASGRPQGWGHDDWLNFLESLQSRGHDIADREAIGVALEKERLDLALSGIRGIGPQKRQALIEKYGNTWSLRNADPDEIARVASVSRSVADRVRSELQ